MKGIRFRRDRDSNPRSGIALYLTPYTLYLTKRLILSALLIAATGAFFYDWRKAHPRDIALVRLENEKLFLVGIDPSYPPFAIIQNDLIVGLDADLAREIGRRLGATNTAFRVLGYDGLYDALRVGEADALISAVRFDPARLGDTRYSTAYFDSGPVIVSRAGYADMRALEGKRVAIEPGTHGDETVRLWQRRLHQLERAAYESSMLALDALRTGETDTALVDRLTAQAYLKQNPDFVITAQSPNPDPVVIATRSSSGELLKRINTVLDAMRADGTIATLLARWT